MRKGLMVAALALTVVVIGPGAQAALPQGHPRERAIVDTLGVPTSTTFSHWGGWGAVGATTIQHVGPRFVLGQRTRITEIGAYVNANEEGVLTCGGDTEPLLVEIHADEGGVPSFDAVATYVMSDDGDPCVWSYESVRPKLRPLRPGVYYAIFVSQRPEDLGGLLTGTPSYVPASVTLGAISGGAPWIWGTIPAAVRILGIPLGKTA